FEPRRLLDGKIRRSRPLEDTVDVVCQPLVRRSQVRPIAQERAASGKNWPSGDDRRAMAQGEIDDRLAILDSKAGGEQQDRLGWLLLHRREGFIEFVARARREVVDVQTESRCILFGVRALQMLAGMRGVGDEGNAAQPGNDLAEQFEALAVE